MRFFIAMILLIYSSSSYAFMDKLFEKAGGASAIASGTDDLISELDENSSLLKDVKKIGQSANDVREILSEVDSTIYDVDYISSSINQSEEVANKMHIVADKTRRVKRLVKRLGLIAMDAPSAGAMEQIRTNTILDNYISDKKEQELNAKEERLKKIAFIAKREKQADKSLSNSLMRNKERDRKSGVAFNPFSIPNGTAAVNDSIMMSIYDLPPSPVSGL